ncbi:MAG: hypothetical protein HOM25_06135 [Rhodospirillaceae bacterium]|jgi:hypothetical protein|nr:hypothetical protein [Rhodospirillaceae bacterium]MBT5665922.1 hypothetical protein [Rhodospirillaceae bacterium]MBT5809561.1 hypothetical protein [Rhodospirillaceae bacterium]
MTKGPLLALAAAIITIPLIQAAGPLIAAKPAIAGAPGATSFAITTSGQSPVMAWRINQTSGAVSVCHTYDPNSAPRCTPWSKN